MDVLESRSKGQQSPTQSPSAPKGLQVFLGIEHHGAYGIGYSKRIEYVIALSLGAVE
jgi:hypothetical protein